MNIHGGDIFGLARRLGCNAFDILDFSSNISPIFTPGLKEILCEAIKEICYLPDVQNLGIRRAMCRRYGLDEDCFWPGGGTTEFIYAIPKVFPKAQAVVPVPTYADYETAAKMAGMPVRLVEGQLNEDGMKGEEVLEAILNAINRPSLIFLCNPNNPTGLFLPRDSLFRAILATSLDHLWVVDESYLQFVAEDDTESLLTARPFPSNLLVLRSFSKIYAVPGLRLGCVVGDAAMIARLKQEVHIPWNVNRLAQVAGEYLLQQKAHEAYVRGVCQGEKAFLLTQLKVCAPWLKEVPGQTHFFMLRLEQGFTAKEVVQFLNARAVLVRDCGNFKGLNGKEYIRISPRQRPDNQRLIALFQEFAASRIS